MKLWFLILILSLLSACTGMNEPRRTSSQANQHCGEAEDADTAMRLDVVRKVMEQGRLYAALAHLDDIDTASLQAAYLRADILRQSDRSAEARPIYESLLDTCLEGEAHHGLGLIAGRNGQLNHAVSELARAADLLPVNPRVRNDYGYALLLKGDSVAAQHEFLTAIELDPEATLAETNLVILLYMNGDQQKAEAFARRVKMDQQTLADLQQQAAELSRAQP
jgi:Flp pilus assembly protein TadD